MGAAAVLAGEAGTATGGTGGGAGAGEVGTTAGGAPVGPAGTGGFFSPPTGKWTTVCCPSTLITRPIGIFRLSSTKITSFMFHSSSSIFSGSSFGADRFCLRDIFMLPSEQVELAGLGGGGIEAESYSSFCLSFSRGSSGNLGLFGG